MVENKIIEELLKPIIILPIIISLIGWVITYFLTVSAQEKIQKNQIHFEIYNKFIHEIDEFSTRLSFFNGILNSFKFYNNWSKLPDFKERVDQWINEASNVGSNLSFYKLLRTWESYEIFLQDLSPIRDELRKKSDHVSNLYREVFLFSNPIVLIGSDVDEFIKRINKLNDEVVELNIYLLDAKKVVQNHLFEKYMLKQLKLREPTKKEYKVLTKKGLKSNIYKST